MYYPKLPVSFILLGKNDFLRTCRSRLCLRVADHIAYQSKQTLWSTDLEKLMVSQIINELLAFYEFLF
jgi:hypothetical protein